MKSTKLFAALAATALFAACAEEEIVKVDNAPQTMEQVVGTKMIGVDLGMKVDNAAGATRYADGVTRNWDESDVIGLAWVVKDSPYTYQNGDNPTGSVLYANHLFAWDKESGNFTSRGNFYQGWHFAYYPWKNMPKTAIKRHEVNPAQGKCEEGQDPLILRKSQALNISNKQFLTEANVDDNNVLNKKFNMWPTSNFMNIRTNPVGAFVKGATGDMGNNRIKSFTVEVGQAIFAEGLEVDVTNIPTAVDGDEDYANYLAAAYNETTPILKKGTLARDSEGKINLYTSLQDYNLTTSVTTDVFATEYRAYDQTKLIAIVTPANVAINKNDVVITVTLEDDTYFKIEYVDDAEAGSSAAKNNAAIEKMVKAWGAPVEGETVNGVYNKAAGQSVAFDVDLYEEIYVVDELLHNIDSKEKWNRAMEVLAWLGRTTAKINLTGNIVFDNADDEGIMMPANNCSVEVRRDLGASTTSLENSTLTIAFNTSEDWAWPSNLDTDDLIVKIADNTTVNNANTIIARQIYNDGTLIVPDNMTLKSALWKAGAPANVKVINNGNGTIELGYLSTVQGVENYGTIEVIYGSYVKDVVASQYGEIAYVVSDSDKENTFQIANVVNDGIAYGNAYVNVLKFHKDNFETPEFNFTYGANEGHFDPYTGTTTGSYEGDTYKLDGVSLDINGVAVFSTCSNPAKAVNVANVTIEGEGTAALGGYVNVIGDLTVYGENTVNVLNIQSAELSSEGNVAANEITVTNEINVSGLLEAKTSIFASSITAGSINATDAGTITATEIVANGDVTAQTITGKVEVTNGNVNVTTIDGDASFEGCEVNVGNVTGSVTAENSAIVATASLVDVTINGGSVTSPAINSVVVEGGETAITSAAIAGSVTIKGGDVTATNVNAAGDLNVDAGTYTINADAETSYANIVVAVGATLVVNQYVATSTIDVAGTATVDKNVTLYYTTNEGFFHTGTTTGKFEYRP